MELWQIIVGGTLAILAVVCAVVLVYCVYLMFE